MQKVRIKPIFERQEYDTGSHGFTVVCGKCKTTLFPSSKFCMNCGEEVDTEYLNWKLGEIKNDI